MNAIPIQVPNMLLTWVSASSDEWLDFFHHHCPFGPSNHHVYLVIIFSFSFITIVKTTQSDVLDMVLFELVCSLDSDKKKKEKCWSKSLPCPLRLPVTQTTGAWRRNLERDSWPDWSYRTFFKWVFREEWKVTIKFTLALHRTHLEIGIS